MENYTYVHVVTNRVIHKQKKTKQHQFTEDYFFLIWSFLKELEAATNFKNLKLTFTLLFLHRH